MNAFCRCGIKSEGEVRLVGTSSRAFTSEKTYSIGIISGE
jgi:hypothetical protein